AVPRTVVGIQTRSRCRGLAERQRHPQPHPPNYSCQPAARPARRRHRWQWAQLGLTLRRTAVVSARPVEAAESLPWAGGRALRSQDRQRARPYGPAAAAHPRRRGDRVNRREVIGMAPIAADKIFIAQPFWIQRRISPDIAGWWDFFARRHARRLSMLERDALHSLNAS